MSIGETLSRDGPRRAFPACAVGALLLAVGMFAVQAASGFPRLADSGGDSDSLMRLVEIRDLMAGQGWFDLTQYRLGLAGGIEMHWSRLVDLPIAILIGIFGLLPVTPPTAETVALVVWPFLLLAACLFLIMRAARSLGGDEAILPAGILGVAALYQSGIFAAGAIDHHNVQLLLALAITALLVGPSGVRAAALAGVAAGLMLAVGMEGLPVVAAAGLAIALRFWWLGAAEGATAAGFGMGLGGTSLAAMVVTRAPSQWLTVSCDALSVAQVGSGVIAGCGIALAALSPKLRATFTTRSMALLVLAVALGGTAVAFFPQCLSDPYAGLDPRLQRYWLESVTEAQPIWSFVHGSPAQAAAFYVTPLLALALLGWRIYRDGANSVTVSIAMLLLATFLTSLWQVRGALFAVPVASIVLSGWVADHRRRVQREATSVATLAMAAVWIVSLNVAWGAFAAQIAPAAAVQGGEAVADDKRCYARSDYAALAGLPDGSVLAVSNLGSPILAHTRHRAIAGPYHRNIAGNLAVLDVLMGSDAAARAAIRKSGATFLAHCPGNPESVVLARWSPGSLIDRLNRGVVPNWLQPLSPESEALQIYKVTLR